MRLAEAMLRRQLKNTDIAKAVGVTAEAVRLWKVGQRFPRREHLAKLSEVTGLTLEELRHDIFGAPEDQAA